MVFKRKAGVGKLTGIKYKGGSGAEGAGDYCLRPSSMTTVATSVALKALLNKTQGFRRRRIRRCR